MANGAFQSILLRVDSSPMSDVRTLYVRALADIGGVTVTLLHIVPWLSG
ncbi:MAG TPA: hypothetical protein VF283_11555 [Bryobacteraceae bacterium]|nr:hypothetical protein [Candidatus Acidoferrales bacterium]